VSAELPSYEELAALVVELRAEVAALRDENAGLRAQLGQNGRSSSKPPSSDGPAKPAPKSLRAKSRRRSGGQAGHRGQTLCQVADPDRRRRHVPHRCRGCGASNSSGNFPSRSRIKNRAWHPAS
jgi:transposase